MPLYEFRCEKCERTFALLVGMTAKQQKRVCPHCGSRQLTKLISRIAPVVRSDDFDDDFGDDLGDDGDFPDDDGLDD